MSAEWGTGRRAGVWANVVAQVALLLALLVMVNLLAHKFPRRLDLTSRRTYALSTFAEDLLRGLKDDIDVWVSSDLYETTGDKSLAPALKRTWELLQEFQKRTPRFRVHAISLEGGEASQLFRQHWPAVNPCTIYVLARRADQRTNKKIVELYQLYQGDALSGEIQAYRGEPVLVKTVRDLLGDSRRIFYEVEGHQETLTGDDRVMRTLREFLKFNEGVEFRRWALQRPVPVDCDVLMILGPAQPFQSQEADLLREYLERGGSLIVALKPKTPTGLEDLLKEYGLQVGDNMVHDLRMSVQGRMSNLVVNDFNVHEINRNLVNLQLAIPECGTIDPLEQRNPDWKIVPLIRSGPDSWEEKGPIGPGSNPRKDGDERAGPLNLVVAVEKKVAKPMDDRHTSAKLIVWGSMVPFTNAVLRPPQGPLVQEYLAYVVNHFRWLTDRDLMTVDTTRVSVKPLVISQGSFVKLQWVVWLGFPALGIVLGLLAWFIRRK